MSAWYFIKQLWYSDMADVIIIKDKHKHHWPLIKIKVRKVEIFPSNQGWLDAVTKDKDILPYQFATMVCLLIISYWCCNMREILRLVTMLLAMTWWWWFVMMLLPYWRWASGDESQPPILLYHCTIITQLNGQLNHQLSTSVEDRLEYKICISVKFLFYFQSWRSFY